MFTFKKSADLLGWEIIGQVLAPAIYKCGEMAELGKNYLTDARKLDASL